MLRVYKKIERESLIERIFKQVRTCTERRHLSFINVPTLNINKDPPVFISSKSIMETLKHCVKLFQI